MRTLLLLAMLASSASAGGGGFLGAGGGGGGGLTAADIAVKASSGINADISELKGIPSFEGNTYNTAGGSKTFLVAVYYIVANSSPGVYIGPGGALSTREYGVLTVATRAFAAGLQRDHVFQMFGPNTGQVGIENYQLSGSWATPGIVFTNAGGTRFAFTASSANISMGLIQGTYVNAAGARVSGAIMRAKIETSTVAGLGTVPTLWQWDTSDRAGSVSERCRISSSGTFQCGTTTEAPLATRLYAVDTTAGSTGPVRVEGANGAIFQMNGAGQLELVSSAWIQPQTFISSITSRGGISVSTSPSANPALATDSNGVVRVGAGGRSTATVGGTVWYEDYDTVTTTTTPGAYEIGFSTYSTPPGALRKRGDCFRAVCTITQGGTPAATIKIRWGGTEVVNRNGLANGASNAQAQICRRGANEQLFSDSLFTAASATRGDTQDETTSIPLTCNCTTTNTNAGTCSFAAFKVTYEPAP